MIMSSSRKLRCVHPVPLNARTRTRSAGPVSPKPHSDSLSSLPSPQGSFRTFHVPGGFLASGPAGLGSPGCVSAQCFVSFQTFRLKPWLVYFWLWGHQYFHQSSGPPGLLTVISSIMSLCQANGPATILRAAFLSTDIISQRKMEIKKEKKFIHSTHQQWPAAAPPTTLHSQVS